MTKKLVMIGTAVMSTLLGVLIIWQFRNVLVYVLISLTLAAAMRPLIKRLAGRGILMITAWVLVYIIVLFGFGFFLFLAGKTAIVEIEQLAQSLSVQNEWVLPAWLNGSSIQLTLVTWLPPPDILFEAVTGSEGQFVLPAVFGISQGLGGIMSGVILILLLSIYWSISQITFERLWLSLLPSDQRKRARNIWRHVELDIGKYIHAQIIQSLLAGILFGIGYWLLGSPYPAFLSLAGALVCLIPVIGVVFAVVVPLIVGLLTSVQLSVFTVLYTLIVIISIAVWVKPRLFKRSWSNPILTVILLITLADAFGLVGIIVAPLISVIILILWNNLVSHRLAGGASEKLSDLRDRQDALRETIKSLDEESLPLVNSSMERLTELIEKSEPILQAALSGDLIPASSKPWQNNTNGE